MSLACTHFLVPSCNKSQGRLLSQSHAAAGPRPFQPNSRCSSRPASSSDRPSADHHRNNNNDPLNCSSKEHRASHHAAFQELHGPLFERNSQFTLVPPYSSVACWDGSHPALGRVAVAGGEAAPATARVAGGGADIIPERPPKPQGGVVLQSTPAQEVPGARCVRRPHTLNTEGRVECLSHLGLSSGLKASH